MYESKSLWGLESNPNANTINNTFNTFTGLTPLLIVAIVCIGVIFVMASKRGF